MKIKLIGKEALAEGTIAFRFGKPDGFDFVAGQHIEIKLNDPEKDLKGDNSRILSVASAPHENFIMVATRMTGSPFKERLARTDIGTELEMNGPWGDFVLHKDSSKPAVFLIGGIGITPIRSMILSSIENQTGHSLHLFYSNRRPEDVAFQADFEKVKKDHPEFNFVETMTNSTESEQKWAGDTGYIDADMVKGSVGNTEAVFYVSGPPKMVKSMKKLADSIGVEDLMIRAEEFSGY